MLKPRVFGGLLSLLLLCSCATVDPARLRLPADVPFNKNAGRGAWLVVTLRLESGEQLPFLLDTRSPGTWFNKSQEPKLGKRLGTMTSWNFGAKQESGVYAAPTLYLGSTRLLMTGTNIGTYLPLRIYPSVQTQPVEVAKSLTGGSKRSHGGRISCPLNFA
jgi:hypothetical protein